MTAEYKNINFYKLLMKKQQLKKLIEPFIYKTLNKDEYFINSIIANNLLTWNRLDLAFKLFYLSNKIRLPNLAVKMYKEDIKSQTMSSFIEYGNENEKNNFESYLTTFNLLFENLKINGFDENKTILPLCKNGKLINGSHRVASAIYLNKNVSFVTTEQNSMIADYKYFFERNVSIEKLDIVVKEFIKYSSDNVYVAFLWPSANGQKELVESFFTNVVYKKEIHLNQNGAKNLLIELYKHMDWSGSIENNYDEINLKVFECFPTFNPFTVIAFQSDSIESVIELKRKVREVYNIGFSSIHITDTKEEALRISKLIFNENGIHFLNYAKPYTYKDIYKKINDFKKYLELNAIKTEDVVLDGSLVLALYGIRMNKDVDFLLNDNIKLPKKDFRFDTHDSQIKYYKKNKNELIYNPKYYFEFLGFKFVSFNESYFMKKNRCEKKDINDCDKMKSIVEKSYFKKGLAKLKQTIFYFNLKAKKKVNFFFGYLLRKIGLYKIVKSLLFRQN